MIKSFDFGRNTHEIIIILLFHESPFNYPIYFRYNLLLEEFFCVFLLLWDHEICIYKNVLLVVKIFGFKIRTKRKIEKEILLSAIVSQY